MGKSRRSRASNSKTAKFDEDPIEMKALFSAHYNIYYMEDFVYHGNQSFNPIWSKVLCSLSPSPLMLHIIFDQD